VNRSVFRTTTCRDRIMFQKLKELKQKFDTLAMAAAFAEEGSWQTAEQLMDDLRTSLDNARPKLLLASADREFSPSVIDYTVHLAQRMKLDILALNILQPGSAFSRMVGRGTAGDKNRLQHLLEMQNLLLNRAREMEIRCEQGLLKDDMKIAIGKVSRLIRRVELVIIQRNWEKDPHFQLRVPVYMVTPR